MSPNMNVLSLIGILLVFYALRTSGVPITYDFTDPLNAIIAGNLSVQEFSTNIKSHFGNLATALKLSVAYTLDCKILVECGSAMTEAIQILRHVNRTLLTQKVKLQHINFRFRIGIGELESLQNPMNQTKLNIPDGKHDISLFLPDNTPCDDLRYITKKQWDILVNSSTWVSSDSLPNVRNIGFGYNSGLIGCDNMYPAWYLPKYLLTTIGLGKTSCVFESFGLFKKRMDDLHARNIEYTEKFGWESLLIDYSSTSHCLGDKYYGHLLESYWERYTNNKIGATIPMPVGPIKILSNKIIPYIDVESCYVKYGGYGENYIPWLAPAALETLSRYFGAVVLSPDEWDELRSNASAIATNGNPDIRLDLFIDFSDWLRFKTENNSFAYYYWPYYEKKLNELDDAILQPLQNIKVTSLLFRIIPSPTDKSFAVNVDTDFARQMSSRFLIGCAFGPNSFGTLLKSTSSAVVAACKQVNGSIYTLYHYFKLKSITKLNKENSQHFENVVRPKLEEMRKFREEVLVFHPEATVYFQLQIELKMNDNQTTVFCNSEALSLNEYVEATANWAALNAIPLIMGRAFDGNCATKHQTWLSVLRLAEESTEENLYHINPRFVLRNSPQILANAEVEPCLEWTLQRPIVTESYFYNTYLGSIFSTFDLREDKPITREEYGILLQLTFHRFDLVMVLVTSDTFKDFTVAINTLVSNGLIGPRKKFFIFYRASRGEEELREFYGFLNFTKVTLGSNVSLLKGINFYDDAFKSRNEIEDLTLTTRRNTMAFEWGRSLNLDLGIELNIDECHNIIAEATSRKLIPKETDNFLHTAAYLVCWNVVDLKNYNNQKYYGILFDTHLYIKKVYQEFYPHLDVYFGIDVRVDLTETTMTEYLILLSHFRKFASAFNLSYHIVDAFERQGKLQTGWWNISNYSNLSELTIYEEKYSASVGSKTWVPSLHLKQNQTTNTAKDNKENKTTNTADDNKLYIILGALTSILVITIAVLGLVLWYYNNRKPRYLSNEEEKEFYNGKEGTSEEQTAGDSEYRKFDKKFELAFGDIVIDPKELLGRGNFGTVYKGLVKEEPVAIKRPNDNCSATSFKNVLGEVKLLCYIGAHSNVIQFVGAYTKEIRRGTLYIATELCSNGSLDGLLRAKKRVISNMGDADNETILTEDEDSVYFHDLHRFAVEIASGMDYIAGKNVIHGDLAARNVLLDQNLTCKIGDFGLSRKLYEYQQYVKQSQEPLPWKWMAYESLENMQFTTKSDVWSYGVTLWEIYSLGKIPYGGLSWTTGFANDLKNGLRLQKPEYGTEEVYKVMLSCWELEADERPTFTDMVDFFKELTSSQYIVLEI